MPSSRPIPIKRRLTMVILLTCSLVLLLACAGLATVELFEYRRSLVHDTTVLTEVLAKNTRAAVAFNDDQAARETLGALAAEPSVSAACVFTPGGQRIAEYDRSKAAVFPTQPGATGERFERGHLIVVRDIVLDGKNIGAIYVQADMSGVFARLRIFGVVALLILCGSFGVASILAARFQQPISEPILALAEAARGIGERKDYSVRVPAQGSHEVVVLTDAFNQMLGRISDRESDLRGANDALRAEVAERQSAEQRVQSQLARLELLNQITRAIGERRNLQNIFQVAIRNLEEHLPVDFCCICIYEPPETLVVSNVGKRSAARAGAIGLAEKSSVTIEESGLARCTRGSLVYEPDTGKVAFPVPKRIAAEGLHSMVAAPLLVESKVFGILFAARSNPNAFSSGECEFLKQLSEHIALAAHQAQLYDALQQAFDDLRQTQQAAMQQERLRALGQMASGIAHDINNAISPVALYTESLLENEPALSPRARSYLETIQRAIEDVAATVARMREFYRQREPQMNLQVVDLNHLVGQVLQLSRARWSDIPQQRGAMVNVHTNLAPNLPGIMGVESEIRDALINLIFNAVDAMPDGGQLSIHTFSGGAAASEQSAPANVVVEVTDTGVGMDQDTRRRCLEPFFTTKGERGTGLGLAGVYGMVKRHGAEIEIESQLGKGTTVRLRFPRLAEAAHASSGAPTQVAVPSRVRLLIVDDDPLLIKSLRDILETDGHQVTAAHGGQAGIDAFRSALERKTPFALVITDLGMPEVDGRKVAAALKESSPATPIILLTGWGERIMIEGDVPSHVDRVLSKPPRLRELREAMANCLSKQI